MANFTIRVELRGNPTYEQYERLHTLMSSFGFYRTISGVDPAGNSRMFNLPHAVYFGSSQGAPSDIRTRITAPIKTQVQSDIIIFISETVNWALGG